MQPVNLWLNAAKKPSKLCGGNFARCLRNQGTLIAENSGGEHADHCWIALVAGVMLPSAANAQSGPPQHTCAGLHCGGSCVVVMNGKCPIDAYCPQGIVPFTQQGSNSIVIQNASPEMENKIHDLLAPAK